MTKVKLKQAKPPAHLATATQKWWRSVCESFDLEDHHIRLLTLAAESWDLGQQARQALQKNGLTYCDHFGQPKSRPEVAIARDSRIAFARLLRELALDVEEPADPPRGQRIHGRANSRLEST